ncbi:hypothetical protein LR48_Vigan549s007600 [Vigna angularis]|uniref:non-specific serine/threonine protein kinase n=1 Tax=Phaseolus angularis TaxID=3914 RepID=A0A0L9TDQ6_PHAAN|nr:hypothetical protein LR48_Vigan549s007600 [Vigna angularis]
MASDSVHLHLITILHHSIIFLLLFKLPSSLSSNDTHSNCANVINCGKINIGFPFWGGNRPRECGHPLMELICENETSYITIKDVKYQVLEANPDNHTLKITRQDYWIDLCQPNQVNTSLNTQLYVYDSPYNNLSLSYGCTPSNSLPLTNIPCDGTSGETEINSFIKVYEAIKEGFVVRWIIGVEECDKFDRSGGECGFEGSSLQTCYCRDGAYPNFSQDSESSSVSDPILGIIECVQHISVPILKEQADRLVENRPLLGEILMKRFNVNNWKTGLYLSSSIFTVFGSTSNKHLRCKRNNVGVAIGATVGGVAALVVILGCVYFIIQRRRKIYQKSRNMELFIAPTSSGDTFASTTITSQSLSYQSSNPVTRSYYFGVQVFSYEELEEATKNFDASRELGKGGFGTVYKGELKDGRTVAVKRHNESNSRLIMQFMNEVQILARLRHKNLVTLFGCTSKRSRELLLVYEFIPNGTVAYHLRGRGSKSTLLPWPIRLNIAVETAEALAYLHANDVIHRDVKTNNILLDDQFCVKVADFGLLRDFPTCVTHVSTGPQGTPGYVDPEYYQCYQLTDKSDVYSFGVVLVELISSLRAVDFNRNGSDGGRPNGWTLGLIAVFGRTSKWRDARPDFHLWADVLSWRTSLNGWALGLCRADLVHMALRKIQNQELHELVDPYLGFEKDHAMRIMTTAVATLAFRCLQQERDLRPCMDEVVEILRGIKSDELGAREETEILDIRTDEAILLKKAHSSVSNSS